MKGVIIYIYIYFRDERVCIPEIRQIRISSWDPNILRFPDRDLNPCKEIRTHTRRRILAWFWIGMSGLGSLAPPTSLVAYKSQQILGGGDQTSPGHFYLAPLCILCSLEHCKLFLGSLLHCHPACHCSATPGWAMVDV